MSLKSQRREFKRTKGENLRKQKEIIQENKGGEFKNTKGKNSRKQMGKNLRKERKRILKNPKRSTKNRIGRVVEIRVIIIWSVVGQFSPKLALVYCRLMMLSLPVL